MVIPKDSHIIRDMDNACYIIWLSSDNIYRNLLHNQKSRDALPMYK